MTNKPCVLVAMSGGVDSGVAAGLLSQAGYAVEAVFMYMGQEWEKGSADFKADMTTAAQDAQETATQLGIPFQIVDYQKELKGIIDYFVDQYRQGRTPNPCLMCNSRLKFGKLFDFAKSTGADYIATGHYARIKTIDGHKRLCRAIDKKKDQSYALFGIERDKLGKILLPTGEYTKTQVRKLALRMNLPVHDKDESQEICFVPDDDYTRLVATLAPELSRPGPVINTNGETLGEHQGIYRYTIGQRRGMGIALGEPAYVVRLDAESNTVVLGNRDELLQRRFWAEGVNWLTEPIPTEPFAAIIQIRYNHRGAAGTVTPLSDENGQCNRVMVDFAEPVSAITPGQAAVFYSQDNQVLLGGGWIESPAHT